MEGLRRADPVVEGRREAEPVAEIGELLGPLPGDRVLEVGTGSGRTACLLAELVGPHGRVVSLEADAGTAGAATERIAGRGFPNVRVVRQDALSFEAAEPFDRLHVRVGMAGIPWNLLAALRPGGLAVVPWCPAWGPGHRLTLIRLGREAVGRIDTTPGIPPPQGPRPDPPARARTDVRRYATRINPLTVGHAPGSRTYGGGVVIAAMAPGVHHDLSGEGAGRATLRLHETGSGAPVPPSWATVAFEPDADDYEVTVSGKRDLWEEVTSAWMYWNSLGRPERGRFGMTVSRDGQEIWLDKPSHIIA